MNVFSLAAFKQLYEGPVSDGDLVSKQGRSDLIENGLAERVVAKSGLVENRLTKLGERIANRLF